MFAQFAIRLFSEPGGLERIVQPFTVAGQIPDWLLMRTREQNTLIIACFRELDPAKGMSFAARLRAMPCARAVRLFFRESDSSLLCAPGRFACLRGNSPAGGSDHR